MRILVFNCGSSTLKFKLFAFGEDRSAGHEQPLVYGIIERIGGDTTLLLNEVGKATLNDRVKVPDHKRATHLVLDRLGALGYLRVGGIDAVGYRVVHGGPHFIQPTFIDESVLEAIEMISKLALLHNHPAIETIRATRTVFGTTQPMVAVFDTAFHSNMPDRASHYPIPLELKEKHYIFRYGFHGIAHRYMVERYAAITSTPLEKTRLITLQLGSGCSVAAIQGGISIDTSMGLTPLEGLMMGTRSGDVDPHLAGFLAEREGIPLAEAETILNKKSGLLGVSGLSQDMRELIRAESEGDKRAALAIEMFCYRIKKQMGAYLAALGGAEAVIFGGGIGENSPHVRSRICEGMGWCGLELDAERNDRTIGQEGPITGVQSKMEAFVIPVDEEVIIARDTVRCLRETPIGSSH